MTQVVSSRLETASPQIDGRNWVTEAHTLSDGTVRQFTYLAEVDADCAAIMVAREEAINSELAEAETP